MVPQTQEKISFQKPTGVDPETWSSTQSAYTQTPQLAPVEGLANEEGGWAGVIYIPVAHSHLPWYFSASNSRPRLDAGGGNEGTTNERGERDRGCKAERGARSALLGRLDAGTTISLDREGRG